MFQFKDAAHLKLTNEAFWKQVPTCPQKCGKGRECHRPTPSHVRWWEEYREGADTQKLRDMLVETLREEAFNELCEAVREANPRLDFFQIYAVIRAVIYSDIGGRGALILGAAGTGKSEVLRTIRKVLGGDEEEETPKKKKKQKKQAVRVCAYTHAATRMVGGETIAHLLHLNTQLTDATFLVDEVGLLPLSTVGAMSKWMALGCKFVCFGDFMGQFEPFRDRWNLDLQGLDYSPLLHEMCNGVRIELTKYRRGIDPELFAWYHSCYGQENVRGLIAESRERYPAACDRGWNPLVLCVSHAKRMIVNTRQNELLKPEGAVHLEWEGEDIKGCTMQPQSMFIWKGLELIGCSRGSGKSLVVQGVIYVITDITETECHLTMRREYWRDEDVEETVTIELVDACAQLRPSHAICYYTVQGRTVKDRHIVLLDTNHPHFTVRSLIVGLSRVEDSKYLHIGDCNSERLFVGERKVRQRVQKPCETA